MVIISDLCDDLLLKILSFLPTKVAVSTSLLSKRWEFLWMWLPKLEYNDNAEPLMSSWLRCEEFMDKNLPLHRAPVIESLLLGFHHRSVASLPSSLYTCNSLMTLKLEGKTILVDVPRIVCLPSLKTLKLERVTYSNEDSLGLLLSHCPVLEDVLIERDDEDDNVRALVVNVPSLQRLSLKIGIRCYDDGYVIVTPCLKYLKIMDSRDDITSYLTEPMPELEEADIDVMNDIEKILESITSVRRLSLQSSSFYSIEEESVYRSDIVFSQLEHLKLSIVTYYWSKFLIWLLGNSPKLRVLNLYVHRYQRYTSYQPVNWKNTGSSVPECLLRSLDTFEFKDYMGTKEERDFLSFFLKHARCLKSTSITHHATDFGV